MAETTVRTILRAEGLAALLAAAAAAWWLGGLPWWLVALVLIAPDLGIAAFALGPRIGVPVYNALHSYVGPALLAGIAAALSAPALGTTAALWAAHIGFDRALGYGLKLGSFVETHLGRIGRGGA